jgi:flagellar biosynthesis component FlhA
MTNDRKPFEFKKGVFMGIGDITAIEVTISIMAIFILKTSHIPILLLDILIILNIIFAFAILIIAFCTKKGAGSLYKMAFILSTIFIFSINIASIRLIIAKGTGFDGALICFISDLMIGHGKEGLFAGFMVFIALTGVQWLIIIVVKLFAKKTAKSGLDPFSVMERAINALPDSGAISALEPLSQKKVLLRELYFYPLLEGACKLISGNEIFRIVIFTATIIGGILIGANIHSEITTDTIGIIIPRSTFIEAIKIYTPLAISNGILFMFPIFLHSLTVAVTLSHTVIGKEAKVKAWKRIKDIISSISPCYNSR